MLALLNSPRLALAKPAYSFVAAIGVGAIALMAPPVAVLILGAMSALALMRAGTPRLEVGAFAGPAFAAIIVGACVGLDGAIGVVFVWRLFADARFNARRTRAAF